jgi:Centrosomin N-terminal motif 1
MNNPSPSSRGQLPYTPRRQSLSSEQRPATSAGELIEPNSAFLRDALRERKGLPTRARSTTPRRARTGQRAQTQKDEWLQLSGDEVAKRATSSVPRPSRPRRSSDITAAKSTPPVSRGLGSREADAKIDRLEKESWDLKHRIMLYQERAKRMNEELDEKDKEIEQLRSLEHRNDKLEDELESLKRSLETTQEENSLLQDNNIELTQINEEIVQQLEERVKELEALESDAVGRQGAIEEAAGIIQKLEQRLIEADERLRRTRPITSPQQTDSDYFSGDVKPIPMVTKTSPALSNPPQLAPDSDYFSADTSPLITPRSVKQIPSVTKHSPQLLLFSAKETSAAFNREMGIKSVTSKDSLFSMYLETPDLPQKSSIASGVNRLRSLRKKNEAGKGILSRSATDAPKPKKVPQAWSDTRPLRNLYMTGELGLQVQSQRRPLPSIPTSENPSVRDPYSPEDKDREQKVRSNPSISVTQPDIRNEHNQGHTPKEGISHTRSNSASSKLPAPLVRHNTTPARPSPPRTSPRTARAYPSRIVATPHQPRQSATTPPSSAHRLSTSSLTSPTAASRNHHHHQHYQQNTPPHTRLLRDLSHSPDLPTNSTTSIISAVTAPPSTYAAPSAQSAPTYSATKQTTQTHRAAPAPNLAFWPRRYPAWPPSAGLMNRDLLFHGEGMEEMFAGSPTKDDGEAMGGWEGA